MRVRAALCHEYVSRWCVSGENGLARSLESCRHLFPFLHQALQIGLPPPQFVRLSLGFFCARKTLKLRFTKGNRGFGAGNLFFYFVQTVFHLLALDRVQSLAFGFG